jgi:hypothetical protein
MDANIQSPTNNTNSTTNALPPNAPNIPSGLLSVAFSDAEIEEMTAQDPMTDAEVVDLLNELIE